MEATWKPQTLASGVHALSGGKGTPVVLIPGWPETADAFTEIFPLLSAHHQLFAIDPPGLGDSASSTTGFDTAAISKILSEALQPAINSPYHLVGHDIGAWIAYAWASQFPEQILSLTLLDSAIPGFSVPQSFPLSPQLNLKLWQFSFNTLPDLPEILTEGRERQLLNWLFDRKAEHPEKITQAKRDRYVECYARPGGMSNGFAYYQAVARSAEQNGEFAKGKLQMPVLALGGKGGVGENLMKSMQSLAVSVKGGVIDDCGHYVVEEQPEEVAGRLLEFFQHVESKEA